MVTRPSSLFLVLWWPAVAWEVGLTLWERLYLEDETSILANCSNRDQAWRHPTIRCNSEDVHSIQGYSLRTRPPCLVNTRLRVLFFWGSWIIYRWWIARWAIYMRRWKWTCEIVYLNEKWKASRWEIWNLLLMPRHPRVCWFSDLGIWCLRWLAPFSFLHRCHLPRLWQAVDAESTCLPWIISLGNDEARADGGAARRWVG